VHLVGFTIEIYYDARSYKRQTYELLHTCKDMSAIPGIAYTDFENSKGKLFRQNISRRMSLSSQQKFQHLLYSNLLNGLDRVI